MKTKISLVRTRNRSEGVKKAVELLKSNPFQGKSVVLKPNLNSADTPPGSTHIDTLRSLVLTLKVMCATKITVAERSGPGDPTRVVMKNKGVLALAAELDFNVLAMDEMPEDGWVHVHPEGSHWRDGFLFPKIYREAESIVQTCCLKTHAYGGHFTLSLKNSVGMVPRAGHPFMQELHSSPFQRQLIAEINAAYSPDLVVLDGVDAFVDGGPARGKLAETNVILAGKDRVAIDAAGVAVLRLFGTNAIVSQGPVFQQEQIARAVALNLGVRSPDQIEFVTADPESADFAHKITEVLHKS